MYSFPPACENPAGLCFLRSQFKVLRPQQFFFINIMTLYSVRINCSGKWWKSTLCDHVLCDLCSQTTFTSHWSHMFYFFKAKWFLRTKFCKKVKWVEVTHKKKQNSNMCFVSREVVATAQNCTKRFENSQNLLKTSVFTIKAHVNFIQFKLEAAGGILLWCSLPLTQYYDIML